jgi:hypothetical protein
MANNLLENPMVIDTAFSTKASAVVNINVPPGGWVIDHIRWYAPTTASHTFVIKSADGNTILLTDYCVVGNTSVEYAMYGMKIEDFQVPTLASGVLYIYYR